MQDLSIFFEPVPSFLFEPLVQTSPVKLGHKIQAFKQMFPNWEEADIVIFGADWQEDAGCDQIRAKLYELSVPHEEMKLADLGNIKRKESKGAYCEAVAHVLGLLLEAGKRVLVLGNDPIVAYAQYLTFNDRKQDFNYVHVGPDFAIHGDGEQLGAKNYNHHILGALSEHLFQFSSLGYQSYLVSDETRQLLQEMHFETLRYGHLMGKVQEAEPYIRDANMLCLDCSGIRSTDFQASLRPVPAGFSALEVCQIARYVGGSPSIQSVNVSGYDLQYDFRDQSALLAAMMIWYFVDGYYSRIEELPPNGRFRQYTAQVNAAIERIQFYESLHTGRWWMEVPFQEDTGKTSPRSKLIACSANDYESAKEDIIPDRWWKVFFKLK